MAVTTGQGVAGWQVSKASVGADKVGAGKENEGSAYFNCLRPPMLRSARKNRQKAALTLGRRMLLE